MKKLVLIDGHSILNRAFFGVPDLTNSKGLHTNAIYGFLNIMFKILDEEKPDYLAIAFDVKEPTFRHKMYDAYKGTRKPMADELRQQVPVIQELLKAMNITLLLLPGYEADDILGTISVRGEEAGMEVRIVSGDRDLLQLATEHVMIRIPKTKKGVTEIENYLAKDVKEAYGVTPKEFIDLKALMGDTSDNIPGVKGVGEKTATNVISTYGSIEKAYECADEIKPPRIGNLLKEYYEDAKLSKILATINTASPVQCDLEACTLDNMFNPESYKLVSQLEFKSILNKFDNSSKAKTNLKVEEPIELIEENSSFLKFCEALRNTKKIFIEGHKLHIKPQSTQLSFDFLSNNISASEYMDVFMYFCMVDSKLYIINSKELTQEYINKNIIASLDNKLLITYDMKKLLKLLDCSKSYYDHRLKVFDLKLAAYLLNPLKDTYSCDDIARDYLGEDINISDELKKLPAELNSLGDLSLDSDLSDKLALMALIGQNSYPVLEAALKEASMYELYESMEIPLIFALDDMEKEGVLVNRSALKEYGKMLGERIVHAEKKIFEEIGEEFNINSPKQLGEILFGKLKLPGGKKTKTGYSTSADVLNGLAEDYPVVNHILEYRQLTKLKSTYADGLDNYISEDGRIHGTFNQTITATGRISSTEPNLQNIPIRMEIGKKLRQIFVPKENCVFIDADYSQIELRILAHMSKDENLIEAYNGHQDIHKITAAKVFKVPFEEVTDTQRSNAKAVNFGIVYGISSFGLSKDLSITRKEADSYIKQYFENYPGIKEFLDNTVKEAKAKGYVTTLYDRRRPIPELSSSNFMQRSFGERIAMNSPIQGTAADIMKIAMINVANSLRTEGYSAKIVLQVHDELLIECPTEELEKVSELVKEKMQTAANLLVKLEVGLGSGKDWLEAH